MDLKLQRLARRVRGSNGSPVDPQLATELSSEPSWMYPWEVEPGLRPKLIAPHLPGVHETRLEMMRDAVVEAIAAAGPGARVLDLACSEGWFGHRMLELGADYVLGLDLRETNVRRAQLLASHYGLGPDRLEFRVSDVHDVDPEELGEFDVVLLLGLIYHLEDPVGAVRRARACCGRLCVIESQLTRQNDEVEWGYGPGDVRREKSSFAGLVEWDASYNPIASAEYVMSLVPNAHAVKEMAEIAGFRRIERCEAPPLGDVQYVARDRGQFLAWV